MTETLKLTKALIAKPSVTPEDAGCQTLIAERLKALGFQTEIFEIEGVTNLWATLGDTGPVFCFAGHTDVVPPGDLTHWESDPFIPRERSDGYLLGRGAVDMKSGLASMIVAIEEFLKHDTLKGTLALLITSDEEGPSIHGTKAVLEILQRRNQKIDYCLVGEPSCSKQLGDTIKHGRRGSLHGHIRFHGTQGHVAYPETTYNPLHFALAPLDALAKHEWDKGNQDFPPTSFQITNLTGGVAKNVVPETLDVDFNLRFSNELSVEAIQAKTVEILAPFNVKYDLTWDLSGRPFLTSKGALLTHLKTAIHEVTTITPQCSTSGGTSDGRFFAEYDTEVVEFGHCNQTLHQINERVEIAQLEKLTQIYTVLLKLLFSTETSAT